MSTTDDEREPLTDPDETPDDLPPDPLVPDPAGD